MLQYLRFALISFSLIFYSTTCKANGGDSIHVYIFLSETCPICQNSSLSLRSLHKEFKDSGIAFTGVFPNLNMSSTESIIQYGRKYKLDFSLIMDNEHALTTQFAATHTPQVFVMRTSDKTILYRGKIDNTYEALGKKRHVVTAHYLGDALRQILDHQSVNPAETKALGCFIVK